MVSLLKQEQLAKASSMKLVIDILTPKQCMLFAKLSERLRKRGYQVTEVTRAYREVNQLLKIKGITAKVVGKHGGASLQDKLEASVQRTFKLASLFGQWQPDVAVSFASPETSRVAFGLGLPHVCLNDSPHSEAVARLTAPLATLLLTPKFIPKTAWVRFGIQANRIIQYNALDPWAWLKGFKPDRKVLNQLNLNASEPIIVFRAEESFASYLLGKAPRTAAWTPLLQNLLKSSCDFQAVIIPRYDAQIAQLTERFENRAIICKSAIDAPSLLAHSSVFVGAGGTMTAEAALLGIPTFSCYPGRPSLIEKYLIDKRLVIREQRWRTLEDKVLQALRSIDTLRKTQSAKAKELTDSFEDPIEVVVKAIEKTF
jgi:predicted glycosyltransferase